MEKKSVSVKPWFLLCCLLYDLHFLTLAEARSMGVNYGMLGDNLPTANEVVSLYQSKGIKYLRLFDPNKSTLEALQNSGIQVIVGTLNKDLLQMDSDPSFANKWVKTNIVPYSSSVRFRYISAGNEVIPGDLAVHVLPAIKNLVAALKANHLNIQVTTTVPMSVLEKSYVPSAGEFSSEVPMMNDLAAYLLETATPLLVNVYPYFAYSQNPRDISISYAIFNSTEVVVTDRGLQYKNLFDAMIDAVYSALEKIDCGNLEIVVGESGWPSAGNGDVTTIEIAEKYNNNFVNHVMSKVGTPKRPGKPIEAYIFAMFNENLKSEGVEQNFGLYYPNKTEVYHVNFNLVEKDEQSW